jgi:PDZ domain-containing protein
VSLARRRAGWLTAGTAVTAAVALTVVFVPVPFVELSPGPTFDVLGEFDGEPVISISGTPTFPTSGTLDMTTVNERGGPQQGIYVGRAVVGWVDPDIRIVPREALFPEDVSEEQVEAENVALFSDSQATSVAAALTYLDRPVDEVVVVSSVQGDTPADGRLEPGDEIVAVDGVEVEEPEQVTEEVQRVEPGDTVTLTVVRDGSEQDVAIVTTTSPRDPGRAYLGITVGTTYRAPFELDISLDGVGGPSAGLFFSLGIVDKLTPGQLTGGRIIAGTGTITPEGAVGAIGGIEQKMPGAREAGATLFLAPEENCADVLAARVPDGLTVARVATLAEAVTTIEDYVAGRPVTPCS